jgi:hypothetical protein
MSQECEILCERIIKSSEVITPMNLIRATLIDFNSAPSVLGWEERNKKSVNLEIILNYKWAQCFKVGM